MRKKFTPAKMPLRKFASDKEAAGYFETHSLAGVWNQLPEAQPAVRATSRRSTKSLPADEIAAKATRGEDISAYFTNKFTVVRPVRRVNVDLNQGMLRELDARAARLNVSRQAVIKTLLGRALEQERGSKPRAKRKAGEARLSRRD